MTVFLDSTAAAELNGKPGKQAIKAEYRGKVLVGGGAGFTGSVDLDLHFANAEPNANRWDYGVGFSHGNEFALWVESHPASGSAEVAVILKKLDWLKSKLRSPGYEGLAALTKAAEEKGEIPFRWLYKGKTSFRASGREARQLAQKGMKLPERSIRVG
ncbi:hypothetical protein [Rhodovulum sp.]|uniref:hypothetical protein n=1 Tax=Rhodovulum sp. TaxID=34009 RepID=UPI001847F970|nr:hypothetical protein [Rhodovulum sp.]HDR27674.1 hypothetical protein [Rhodovulum sp.]